MTLRPMLVVLAVLASCASDEEVVIDLTGVLDDRRTGEMTRRFEVDGAREVRVRVGEAPIVLEAWVEGGAIEGVPDEQVAAGGSASWLAPRTARGEVELAIAGDGEVTISVWARGTPPPRARRDRALAWFEGALLDDPSVISFQRVMAAIARDGHGGALLDRWFRAFAAGPGAGRATFVQFLDEVAAAQGGDPTTWDLAVLPFKVTGVHNRLDLARGDDCGELRVSIASTHATFSPVHLIFLFRQAPGFDDLTPDGAIHCRGTARRWARLGSLDDASFHAAARDLLAAAIAREHFLLAESVELSISPWQWRQWRPEDDRLTNPPLFQTIDVARVNAPGPLREAFLAEVAANAGAIAARTWTVPARFRSPVAEVQPNAKAALVDLAPLGAGPELPRALGMIGCPRCHTDDADFLQTGFDRRPSPFYDRELDARAARLDALNAGAFPDAAPFGPLQPR